jgi:two-component system, chemotaxis family, chemotaxis protein CheY
VLKKLRELDPDARVLVVSADVQSSSHDLVEEAGARGFLNKPFDRDQLLDALHAAVAEVR